MLNHIRDNNLGEKAMKTKNTTIKKTITMLLIMTMIIAMPILAYAGEPEEEVSPTAIEVEPTDVVIQSNNVQDATEVRTVVIKYYANHDDHDGTTFSGNTVKEIQVDVDMDNPEITLENTDLFGSCTSHSLKYWTTKKNSSQTKVEGTISLADLEPTGMNDLEQDVYSFYGYWNLVGSDEIDDQHPVDYPTDEKVLGDEETPGASPKTSDSSDVLGIFIIMMVSALAASGIMVLRKDYR